jgi:hypothetical protein
MEPQTPSDAQLSARAGSASLEVLVRTGVQVAFGGESNAQPWSRVRRYGYAFWGAARMQVRTTLANVEDLTWVVTEPLLAIVAVAISSTPGVRTWPATRSPRPS